MLTLVLGPSGVGKTEVIRALRRLEPRFVPVKVLVTRPLRGDEGEKEHVSDDELERLEARGELILVNRLYGVSYGTPRAPITRSLNNGDFPIIDWPVDRVALMRAEFPNQTFSVYLEPPSCTELERRLTQRGGDVTERLRMGLAELRRLKSGEFDREYDTKLVSTSHEIDGVAHRIVAELQQRRKDSADA